jgi:hypothetical protein
MAGESVPLRPSLVSADPFCGERPRNAPATPPKASGQGRPGGKGRAGSGGPDRGVGELERLP